MRDRVTGQHCAFKLLAAHAGAHELDALIREFLTLSSLEGLGLPRVIRFGRLPQGDRPYVLRELVAGESLDKLMHTSPASALESLAQIADQLTVLHRAGILHGDIKPANIICRSAGPATLVDFGLATHSSAQAQPYGLTPRYAAPELFAGHPLTTRAEVFALGLILRDISEFVHLDDFPLPIIDALAEVIDQATALDPARRHPSADEFVAALRTAAQMPHEVHGASTALPWPIVGIDGFSGLLLARTLELEAGQYLRIEGDRGSGRTVLLRRLAWSLGVAGKHLAFIDADLRGDPRAFESELSQAPGGREAYLLVDDAERLPPHARDAVQQRLTSGVRLVTVGQLAGHSPDVTLDVPPLDRSTAAELMRRSVPSLTEEALERLLDEAKCRPEALREWVTRIADGTLTNVDDVMQLASVPASIASPQGPGSVRAVRKLLDKGRYKEASGLLDQLATNDQQPQTLAVVRARLKLGLGEPQQSLALLRRYVQDQQDEHATAETWLTRARACLGIGDYAGAAEAALRVSEDEVLLHAEALIQRGLAECYLGKPEAAREALTRALQQAEASASERVLGLAHAALGFLAQRNNELDQAFQEYHEAIKAGQECADASLIANAELNLAGLLKMRGDIAGAIEHFEAAVDGGERSGRRATVRHALLNLANLDLFLGRLARARVRLQALESDRESLQPAQEAQRLGLEAELALRLGQPAESERLFAQSARAYQLLGRELDAAEALLESVLAATQADQPDLVHLRGRIESLRDQLPNTGGYQALFYLAEGRVARASGLEAAARRASERAESEARASGHKEWLWRALAAHADLEQSAGGLLRARQYRESALALLEEMASTLPRDLRDVYWNDTRRHQLRAAVAQAPNPDSVSGAVPFVTADATGGISTWLSSPIDQRLAKILEINAELASDLRLDYLTDRIIEHAIRLSGAALGLILLRDSEGQRSVQSSRSATPNEQRLRFSTTIAETAISTGQPLVTLSAKDDQRMSGWASVHDLMVQSVACVPIRAGRGPTIGALYLETRMRRGSRFQSELPMLQAFADQAAIALQSARLIKENHDRAEELKESNRKLHDAQERLEELLGNRTQQLVRTRRQLQQTRQTLYSHFGYHGLVGTSEAMRRVYAVIDRVKSADVGVLVTGESGTGKEMVARAIHAASDRSRGPFVGVTCGAIPENLLESDLFGSVPGAFTGAAAEVVAAKSALTFVSSARPLAISRNWSRPATSAKTSITGSTSSRSASRPCVSIARTFRNSSTTSSGFSLRGSTKRRRPFRVTRCAC